MENSQRKPFQKENLIRRCKSQASNILKPSFKKNSPDNIIPEEDQISRTSWTQAQQSQLMELHKEFGNKWALIATYLPGRSDNCVKNHFYSKLRKSFRKINRFINCLFYTSFQEIKMTAIYKIVETNDQKHKKTSKVNQIEVQNCRELLEKLLNFGKTTQNYENQDQISEAKNLIREVIDFNMKHKKIHKRRKNQEEEEFIPGYYLRKSKKTGRGKDSDDDSDSELSVLQFNKSSEEYPNEDDNEQKKDQVRQLFDYDFQILKRMVSIKNQLRLIQATREQVCDILSNFGVVQATHEMPLLFLGKNISKLSKRSGGSFNWENIEQSPFYSNNYAVSTFASDFLRKDIENIQNQ